MCIGSAAGANGPILALSKGVSVPELYGNEQYLVDDLGCPPGTQVIATPNGFMTDLAFDAAMDSVFHFLPPPR
jgi:hypothetical protein